MPKVTLQVLDQWIWLLGVEPLPGLRVMHEPVMNLVRSFLDPLQRVPAQRVHALPTFVQDGVICRVAAAIVRVHPRELTLWNVRLDELEVQPQRAMMLCTEWNEMKPVVVWCIRSWSVADKENAILCILGWAEKKPCAQLYALTNSGLDDWVQSVKGFHSGR